MGKLRDARNDTKTTALADRVPRIEIELAGLSSDLSDLTADVAVQITAATANLNLGDIWTNAQAISVDTTILATKNAMMVGPVVVKDGVTLTIEAGARLVII